MRVVLQRVTSASCTVDGVITGQIDKGYLLLVGFTNGDDESKLDKAVKKIGGLRIFEDENGKMNLNLQTVGGNILSISQFTLYANTNDGNRPSFTEAMNFEKANDMFNIFVEELRQYEINVETGVFGADMKIKFTNDGPVTIILDNETLK